MINSHFYASQIFIDPKTRTVVAMTPKVMTTFLRMTLSAGFKKFRGLEHASDGRYNFADISARFPMPSLGGYLDALARPNRFEAYGFVRNPYWRLHSAWRSKFRDPWHRIEADPSLRYPHSVRTTDLPRLRRFADKHCLVGAEDDALVPFETFAEFVVADRALRPNKHWRSQARMLQLDHFSEMHILRFEDDVTDGMTAIFTRLGFEQRWIKNRLSKPRNVSSPFAETPYDERIAAMVYDHFAEDFTRFGYDRDSWQRG